MPDIATAKSFILGKNNFMILYVGSVMDHETFHSLTML